MNSPPLSKKSSTRSIRESISAWSTPKPARRHTKPKPTLLAGPEYNTAKRPLNPAPDHLRSSTPQLFSSYRLRSNSARTRDLDLHSEWHDAESIRYEPSPAVHPLHYKRPPKIEPLHYKPSMNIEELMHLPPASPPLAYTTPRPSPDPRLGGAGELSPRSPRVHRDMYKALPPPPVIREAEYAEEYEVVQEYVPRVEAVSKKDEVFEMPSSWDFEGTFGAAVEVGPFELDTPGVVAASAGRELGPPVELAGAEIAELGGREGEAEAQWAAKPAGEAADAIAAPAPTANEPTPSSPRQVQAEDTAATPALAHFHRRQDSSADVDTPTLPRFPRRQDSFALPSKFPRRLPVPATPPAATPPPSSSPTAPSQSAPPTSILTEMDAALSAFSLTTAEREFVLRASSNWLSQPSDPPPTPPESPAPAHLEKSPTFTAEIGSPAISQLEKVHVSERFDPEMSWLCFSPSGSESSSLYTLDEDEEEEEEESAASTESTVSLEAGERDVEKVGSMYTLEEELKNFEVMSAGEKGKDVVAPLRDGVVLDYF